ncbi:MAG: hypothetical protein A2340_14600 [Lentisphaerae bacterium RIFOXYB12_FULL_60_10]|nr:MAG: hypothetical protein A2340_14600 [Lentisphaerae bacterium RIFOXYB12_FULL_60_10]
MTTGSQRIRVLPEQVANQIAAGEVVERPASVVKELLENALDAGSTRIEVNLAHGGTRLVSVADNGCGMGRDDALLCLERHATSKIRDVHDIEHIATMGFRGEAMAAIASVSRLRMVTAEAGAVSGTEVVVTGGRVGDVRDIGFPPGTLFEVRDLFFNVPARRKFMRSAPTELQHSRSVFLVQAIAHPAIAMSLRVDGRPLYELPAGGTLDDRLRDLFGAPYLDSFRAVRETIGDVTVSGFFSVPSFNRSDRQEQYTFVNGRPTTAPVLQYAVREAYHALMPSDRHPLYFLFVELDPGLVDINVHPTKREVRFRRSDGVRSAVIAAIRKALELPAPAAVPVAGQGVPFTGFDRPAPVPAGMGPAPGQATLRIENLPESRLVCYPSPTVTMPVLPGMPEPATPAASLPPPVGSPPWAWCRIVGQVGGLYVVMETPDGLVLMDPHAAHERVMFERFMAAVEAGEVRSQGLLLPESIELVPRDAARVRQQLEVLRTMGFGISDFGGNAFVVDSLPACLGEASVGSIIMDIATAIEEAGPAGAKSRWREETIARAACRAAVKAHDRLSVEVLEQIVRDLAATRMPYTCPHGRPTMILTSFHELQRRFGRE